jgi:WD40 repeat protein
MRRFRAGKGVVNALAFTPCGRTLHCVESKDLHAPHEGVHWLDVERGQLARTLYLNEEAWRQTVSYADAETGKAFVSPDGRWVAVQRDVAYNVFLDLWSARFGVWSVVRGGEYSAVVEAVCFSAASDLMVFGSGIAGSGTSLLERVELKTGTNLPNIDYPHSSVLDLQFSADERTLFALGFEEVIAVPHDRTRRNAGRLVWLESKTGDRATIRAFPRRNELAIVDGDRVFLWDCQSPDAEPVPDVGDGITDLAFAPDGELWALGYTDGTVRLRTREREVARFDWGIGRVTSVAFAPDGLTCAAGGENGQIVLWDVDV